MTHTLGPEDAGQTLAAVLRKLLPGQSWSQVRAAVSGRRVKLNGELALDPARRLKEGETVEVLGRPQQLPEAFASELVVRHLDAHVVVVEKPPGISTVRHPEERAWSQRRRRLDPTLEDRLHRAIAARLRMPLRTLQKLRKVHRLVSLSSR